ncbi:MAG TPA: helix-turn-helix domain-containing protein [Anaerolineae bacterium]|nr:helix-turn-helix domain-containing protein [Anaerolineae bacterium]HXK44179.1 helix-turn-helix domain-containing protein [Anaerolineae bacterium]
MPQSMASDTSSKAHTPPSLDLYTVAETAAILSVSQKSVFAWIKEGLLPAIRIGPGQKLIRVRRKDLEEFIAQQQFPAPNSRPK